MIVKDLKETSDRIVIDANFSEPHANARVLIVEG